MTIKFAITNIAGSTPFDNSTNGFIADNVQDAIEEAQTSNIGDLITFQFEVTGNTADKWLGYANSVSPSDDIPFICPQDLSLVYLTFSNRDDDVDIDIEIYKDGSLFHTELIRNKRWYFNTTLTTLTFLQGDRISIFLKKYTGGTGDQTAQDPVITLFCKITNDNATTGGAQSGV